MISDIVPTLLSSSHWTVFHIFRKPEFNFYFKIYLKYIPGININLRCLRAHEAQRFWAVLIGHSTPCCPSKILHKHCFQFDNNAYSRVPHYVHSGYLSTSIFRHRLLTCCLKWANHKGRRPVFVSCHVYGNKPQVQKVMLVGCDWWISISTCSLKWANHKGRRPEFVSCHFNGNKSRVQKVMLVGCDLWMSIRIAC